MSTIIKPVVGRPDPDLLPGGDALVGIDGNAYAVMAEVVRYLRYAGASRSYVEAYREVATSSDYDHLLATSVAYLTPTESFDIAEDRPCPSCGSSVMHANDCPLAEIHEDVTD